MKKSSMYKDLAKYYDLTYLNKDYKKESEEVTILVKKYKKSSGNELLDVACGTGKHIQYLNKEFHCTGLDLNNEMLVIARKNVKGIQFKKGDMRNFNLHKQYDVITCLFSSIGYVKKYKALDKTIKNFSNHLKKGGLVMIGAWYNNQSFNSGTKFTSTYKDDKICMTMLNISKKKGEVSLIERHYLIAGKDNNVRYYKSVDTLGLFETSKFLDIMNKNGLQSKFIKDAIIPKRGAYIGIKK